MKNLKNISLLLLVIFATVSIANAQYAQRKLSKKQIAYTDSLKAVEYDYIFPYLGQFAYEKGFDIPYPIGAMANYIWMDQGIVIDNFHLGVNESGLQPIEFIEFGENRNTSYAVNFRPDIWVLPFLNVYGLFGYGTSTTEVKLVKPVTMTSIVTQNMTTKGFGVMGGFGLGPAWVSVDANWTWTKPELLEEAVLGKVLGIRVGKTFPFASHPERNVAFWVGGMRLRMSSNTVGSILLKDAIPQETWDRKDEIVDEYAVWRNENYDNLSLKEKLAVDNVTDPLIERLDNRDGSTVISYQMDKAPEAEWNYLIGGQFQLNKRWMFRSAWWA
jgi:hypothetical protein